MKKLSEEFVLGLDLSFHRTGWAVTKGMQLMEYGIITPPDIFKKITWKDKEFPWALEWLKDETSSLTKKLTDKYGITVAAIEELNIRYVNIIKIIMQIQAAFKLGLIAGNPTIDIDRISNKSVKGFLGLPNFKKDYPTGINGKAKELKKKYKKEIKPIKILAIDKINKLYGLKLEYNQDDEADAIGLCITALYKRGQKENNNVKG